MNVSYDIQCLYHGKSSLLMYFKPYFRIIQFLKYIWYDILLGNETNVTISDAKYYDSERNFIILDKNNRVSVGGYVASSNDKDYI